MISPGGPRDCPRGIGNDWHYCSKDTYDTVNVGDNLSKGYTFVLAEPYVYKNKL